MFFLNSFFARMFHPPNLPMIFPRNIIGRMETRSMQYCRKKNTRDVVSLCHVSLSRHVSSVGCLSVNSTQSSIDNQGFPTSIFVFKTK